MFMSIEYIDHCCEKQIADLHWWISIGQVYDALREVLKKSTAGKEGRSGTIVTRTSIKSHRVQHDDPLSGMV